VCLVCSKHDRLGLEYQKKREGRVSFALKMHALCSQMSFVDNPKRDKSLSPQVKKNVATTR
jgi:hypothetical protein